jgi:hypothetical protein
VLLIKQKYIYRDLLYNFPLKTPHQIEDMNSFFNSVISLHESNKGLGLKAKFSPQLPLSTPTTNNSHALPFSCQMQPNCYGIMHHVSPASVNPQSTLDL